MMYPEDYKKVRSSNDPGHAHELTFSCFRSQPLFTKDRSRLWFVSAMERARQRYDFAIWAYVIMPEHIHIIVCSRLDKYEIRQVRSALKIPVQRKALSFLRKQAPEFLDRLCDRQPNGEVHYRFWQRGGGYDRNVTNSQTLQKMIDYIHRNPVRRGLVDQPTDWIWSSARFQEGHLDVPIAMDPLPFLD
jgi:putative transposase